MAHRVNDNACEYFEAERQNRSNRFECLAKLESFADDTKVIEAYLDYDIRDKKIAGGMCHMEILFALAQIQGIHLRIFVIGDNNKMVLHGQYGEFKPSIINKTKDLLFINNNHFERLELKPIVVLSQKPESEIMKIIAFIMDATSILKILSHIGEDTESPKLHSARGPPDESHCEDEVIPEYQYDQTLNCRCEPR